MVDGRYYDTVQDSQFDKFIETHSLTYKMLFVRCTRPAVENETDTEVLVVIVIIVSRQLTS